MTIALHIRRLRLADYDAMILLFRLCGLNPRTKGRESRPAIAAQLRATRNRYLGAFEGARLVGTVFGTHDSRKGWINRLAVHPEYRRSQVASRLVRLCERGLREQGIQIFAALIEPENSASEAIFRGLGYEIHPLLYARRKIHAGV
jgi:ribosomal protein S18 acetylase RimI-like enzyme